MSGIGRRTFYPWWCEASSGAERYPSRAIDGPHSITLDKRAVVPTVKKSVFNAK